MVFRGGVFLETAHIVRNPKNIGDSTSVTLAVRVPVKDSLVRLLGCELNDVQCAVREEKLGSGSRVDVRLRGER